MSSIGVQHRLDDRRSRRHRCGTHGCFFLSNVAIADVSEAERAVAALAQNFCHRAADGSEADQGDAACGSIFAAVRRIFLRLRRRIGDDVHQLEKWNSLSYVRPRDPKTTKTRLQICASDELRTHESGMGGIAGESASKLIIWCLPAASAIPAGACGHALFQALLASSVEPTPQPSPRQREENE